MSFDYTARVRVGVTLMILLALYANLQMLSTWVQFDLSFVGNDEITLYEKRFDVVRGMLPPNGVVGYVGDPLKLEDGSLNGAALRNWYLAQYALAPVVLSSSQGHRLFVMNKSAPPNPAPLGNGGFTIQELGFGNKVLDFGNGVKLMINESQ
jgi:hypothetical protein